MEITTIILAAGKGTRMYSEVPKILHKIANKALLRHVYDMSKQIEGNDIKVVYGYGGELIREALADFKVTWVEQKQQLGTGHAVLQVNDQIAEDNIVLILYGDVPLLKLSTIKLLLSTVSLKSLGLLTVHLKNPNGYGRIIRDDEGKVVKIVEEKDASEHERQIHEVNTGIMAMHGDKLKKWIARLDNNNTQQEYYLTDIVEIAVTEGVEIITIQPVMIEEVLGVNNRVQLAQLERVYQQEQANMLMTRGVTIRDPLRFDLRGEIENLGQDIEIDVNVILEGKISIGSQVKIGSNTCIKNANIGDHVEILANCVIEDCVIGAGSRIGPYARLRPDTVLSENVHIGNFVEIKKTSISKGSKINHLSYIGDAVVGSNVNIGAGTITCNYDGVNKFTTVIEDGAFIGSDTQLVAPVVVGKDATIGAGSTITKDAPENQLTISRVKQLSIAGWKRPMKQEK